MMVEQPPSSPLPSSPVLIMDSDNSPDAPEKSVATQRVQATQMFFEKERMKADHAKAKRRASLAAMPHVIEESDDEQQQQLDQSIRSTRSHRRASMGAMPSDSMRSTARRRASLSKSGTVTPTAGEEGADGYGTDSEAAEPSRRAKARRASLSLKQQVETERKGRRASLSQAIPAYGMDGGDDDEDEPDYGYAPAMPHARRASLSGGASRRGSNGVVLDPHMKATRRMSNGRAPRRMSNGIIPMVDPIEPISPRKRAVRRMSNEAPDQRGVMRFDTADSLTMGSMGRAVARGINPDALARMSRRMSAGGMSMQDDDDDDEEMDYGYGAYSTPAHHVPVPAPRMERRGSNRSHTSASSSRSRRRNSCLIRKEADTKMLAEIAAGPARVSDSDLEAEEDSDGSRDLYGYGDAGGGLSDSEHSMRSFSSTASRSMRRNSCIIRPDQNPLGSSFAIDSGASRTASRELLPQDESSDDEVDDYNDPDSLLNRSGYFKTNNVVLNKGKEDILNITTKKVSAKIEPVVPVPKPASPVQKPKPTLSKESLGRSAPFTSPRGTLTQDVLQESEKLANSMIPGYSIRNNWGEMGFESMSDSESDSDESFGASMYAESYAFQEIDRYKQRARRRTSIDKTCINMGEILAEGKKSKKNGHHHHHHHHHHHAVKIPDFRPATGCANASDYIVRAFCARLRLGFTVIKHNRSRWSKSQLRILYLLSDGKTLSWKPVEGEQDKGKRPKLDLSKCREVRHAWSPDPETKKQLGTSVMRKRCKDGSANKSFALIFSKRTLDMTALSSDQCRVMMEGFSALCFRLQLDMLENNDEHSSEEFSKGATSRSYLTDDDWASTVYGGESTVSMTQSAATATGPPAVCPWGL